MAAGAGASVALACDLVVATQVGLLPAGVLQDRPDPRYRRHLDPAAARRHGPRHGPGPAGDKLPAEKAAEWGLIWEPCADDALAARIDALGRHSWPRMPTKALVRTRQACTPALGHSLDEQLVLRRRLHARAGPRAPTTPKASAAFMEKRARSFTGD